GPPVRCVMQHGGATAPSRGEASAFLEYDHIEKLMREAAAVVCHGGTGSVMLARSLGKRPIVVPREHARGEHVDDHQVVFVRRMAARGEIVAAFGRDEPFRSCPFWTLVGKSAFGGWDEIDLDDVLRLRFGLDRPWMVPALASRRRGGSLDRRTARYRSLLSALYRGIFEVSGADVIVDSSKMPSHGFIVRGIPEVDLRTVHL